MSDHVNKNIYQKHFYTVHFAVSSAVFGQPLTAVLNQDKSRAVATSPIRTCSFSTGSSPGTPLTDHSHPVSNL